MLQEYVETLKSQGKIIKAIVIGRFALVRTKNNLKLVYEVNRNNQTIIDEVNVTKEDIASIYLITVEYLNNNQETNQLIP